MMDTDRMPSGIEGLGELSYGTHFCLFYETKEDLFATLIGFFKAGLENHEFCLWVTSQPNLEEMIRVLRRAIPEADRYLESGEMEILTYQRWYLNENAFDAPTAIGNLKSKYSEVLAKGYSRMRVAGEGAWLAQTSWNAFSVYERALDEVIANKNLLVICAYSTSGRSAAEILDIARTHNFVAAKRQGNWEILETPQLKQTKMEFQRHLKGPDQTSPGSFRFDALWQPKRSAIISYGVALLSVVIAAVIIALMESRFQNAAHVSMFLCAVLFSAWYGGAGPGLLAMVLSALVFDYSYLSPINSLAVDPAQFPRLIAFVLASLFIVALSATQRSAAESLRRTRDELKKNNQALQAEIVEHQQAADALRQSESDLAEAQRVARLGNWTMDIATNTVRWSDEVYRIFDVENTAFGDGYDSFLSRVHPEDRVRVLEVNAKARSSGEPFAVEYRITTRDGQLKHIREIGYARKDSTGAVSGLFGTAQDITERRQSEEAIRKSEQVLREAETLGHTGSWEQDLVTGEIFNSEENLSLFFGDDRSKGTPFEDYAEAVHPDDREYVLRRREQLVAERGPGDIEYRVVWPDGSIHVLFGRATVVRDESGQAIRVYGTNLEITERKRAEEALRRSENNFRTLAEKSLQGIAIFQDQRMVYANPVMSTILGYTIEELTVLSPEEIVALTHPLDRAVAAERARRRMAGEKISSSIELRVLCKDGSTRWLQSFNNNTEYNGRPAILGTSIDITERKQAEEEIRRNAARAQLLADISQACAEAGLDDQRVLQTITRRTAELVGDGCMILLVSEDRQRLRPAAFHHPDPQALGVMQEILLNAWSGKLDTPISARLLAGEPVWMAEVTAAELVSSIPPEYQPFVERFGISSLLAVPLRVQGQVIGILNLSRDRPGQPYTHADQVLLQDIADRAALTIENARLFQSVSEKRERLRALSARLVAAQETERRTIARELHDEVGQMLTGLQITLKMAGRLSPDATQARLEEAQKLVEKLLDQVHGLSLDLRPPVLDDLGLAPALQWQLDRYTQQTGIQVRFETRGIERRFPTSLETTAYRIIQEGLTNVARHAGVQEAKVRVWAEDGTLGLQIEDAGVGFDVDAALAARSSSGLSGIQEQAELLGGQITIESASGAGTLITVELLTGDSGGEQDGRDDSVGG